MPTPGLGQTGFALFPLRFASMERYGGGQGSPDSDIIPAVTTL
jgi:hypothetical protein